METEEIISSIVKMSNDKLDFKIRNYSDGNWINPLNRNWINQRIYVSVKKTQHINNVILYDIIARVNSESLKDNRQVILIEN